MKFKHFLAASAFFLAAPTLAQTAGFSAAFTSVSESSDSASIILNVNNPSGQSARVWIRRTGLGNLLAGADYNFSDSVLTLPPGATGTQTFHIPLLKDALAENDEYLGLRIDSVEFGSVSGNRETLLYIKDDDQISPLAKNNLNLSLTSSYQVATAGSNSAEIAAYDPGSKRIFVANSIGAKLEIISMANPAALSPVNSIDISTYGNINSVAVYKGIVALSIENSNPQTAGSVVFMNTDGVFQKQVTVGALPDMITFSPDGKLVLTANEGEPNTDYTNDPEGSVSIIDISGGIANLSQSNVTTLDFTAFNGQAATLKTSGVRIFGPSATVAKDLEPEYITVAANSQRAWVTLQENNAIAEIDLINKTIVSVKGLGFKDHSLYPMDASNQGGQIHFSTWPVKGIYMPDAIASYQVGGVTYLVTANEGDAREYNAIDEAARISSLNLDSTAFPQASQLKANTAIGRLNVTNTMGDTDNDGDFDELYSFGSRSFSIWNANTGAQVYDSGDDFERIVANHPVYKSIFNCSNSNISLKDRSDDKGPEPEGVVTAFINDTAYAFIALERIGGVMVYNIQDPSNPIFVNYVNNRSTSSATGDLGAEGIIFIPAMESPDGKIYVIVANEVSATLSVYRVNAVQVPNGIANFSPSFYTIQEKSANQDITINILPAPVVNTQLTVKAYAGQDINFGPTGDLNLSGSWNADSLVINIPAGSSQVSFSIQIQDDNLPEANEEANFFISNPGYGLTLGTNKAAIVNIEQNDGFVGTNLIRFQEWQAYPNPTSSWLYFSAPSSGVLYDMQGREILRFNEASEVNLTLLEEGHYVLYTSDYLPVKVTKN